MGVLCDDVFTITLDQQEMKVLKWTTNNKRYHEPKKWGGKISSREKKTLCTQ